MELVHKALFVLEDSLHLPTTLQEWLGHSLVLGLDQADVVNKYRRTKSDEDAQVGRSLRATNI